MSKIGFDEDLKEFISRLWRLKYYQFTIVFLVMLAMAIYTLVVEEKYRVYCSFYPASPTTETVLNPSGFTGFSLNKVSNQVIINMILILTSDNFWKPLFDKYKFDERLFGDDLIEIKKTSVDPKAAEEEIFEKGMKKLKEEIFSYSHDTDYDLMKASVFLSDKYFAREFLYEVLDSLKNSLHKNNLKSLEQDLNYYETVSNKVTNPVLKNELESTIAEKLKRKYIMTTNQFQIVRDAYIPFKRDYPKRSIMCLVAGFIAEVFLVIFIALYPIFQSFKEVVRDCKK